MGCDLEVDTDGIRRAAALLDEASSIYRAENLHRLCPVMPQGSLGSSPTAREATARVRARTFQVVELTSRLADAAADMAGWLRHVAEGFDVAERVCLTGG